MIRPILVVLGLCALYPCTAMAKRIPPKAVPPVVVNGIRYAATGDGRDSFVVATDDATGRNLWEIKVFHTRIKFWRGEEDNQWLFISDMKIAENSLLLRDEKNRCYSISLSTKQVKKTHCGDSFPP